MSKFFETIYTNKQYNFIIVFLFIIALIRSIIDDFWIPYYDSPCMYLLTFFNTEIYIYLLYFSVGGLSFFYLEKIWKIKPLLVEQQKIYFYSTFLWISYPVVSLISMIAKSPPMMDIPFFKYFPFFMIHRNFFPLGMILVIPVLIAGYTCIISTYSRVSYFKAFIALLPGFFIIYLLFYQYLLRFCYYLLDKFNIFVFFGCYNLMFILFTWIFLKHFLFIYNKKGTLLKGIFILLGIISILLLPIGVYLKNKSVPQSSDIKSLSWKLFLIVVPEDGDKPGGYGFVLVSSKEKKLRVYMKIARSEINCCSFFSHSENGFQINDIRFNYNDSDKLIFQWNKHNTGRDSFLNTFEGRDYLYSGTLFLDGNDRKCIILREEISADEKKIKFWDYETFLFLKNEHLSLLCFQYDNYIDGILRFGGCDYKVEKVLRYDNKIRVLFAGGEINGIFADKATYNIYNIPGSPDEKVINCNLTIKTGLRDYILSGIFGQMEVSGKIK